MATVTETRNGAQAAADETGRATVRAFDTLTDYYLSAFDAGLKFQARWVETAKLLLDESAAFQRSNRKRVEELVQTTRRTQQEMQGVLDTNARAFQSAWTPSDRR